MVAFSLRRLVSSAGGRNFGWLVAEKVGRLLLGVIVGFWVARYLGPADFGRLNAAFSAVALALAVAECGLDAIVRRELLTDPTRARAWLATVWKIRLVAGALCFFAVATGAWIFSESSSGLVLVLIAALQLFQPALAVGDIWLQANLRAGTAFRVLWPVLLLGAVLRIVAVHFRAPLWSFAVVFVIESLVAAAVLTRRARRELPPSAEGQAVPDWRPLLRDAVPLVISGIAIAIYMRIDLVMLPRLAGNDQAGLFAAAVRISELWYFIPGALAASLLPAILAARRAGGVEHERFLQRYFDVSVVAACALALPVACAAPWIIRFAYGAAYAGAAPVLALHIWATVFVFLGIARSQFLLNERLTGFVLAATLSGAVLNIGLNLVLIPRYGAFGAAAATVGSQAAAAWLTSYFHPAVRTVARHQTSALLFPLAVGRLLRAR